MYDDIIKQAARELSEAEARAVETACEASLQGGEHGVLVTRRGPTVTAEVSSSVPYGRVFYTEDRSW